MGTSKIIKEVQSLVAKEQDDSSGVGRHGELVFQERRDRGLLETGSLWKPEEVEHTLQQGGRLHRAPQTHQDSVTKEMLIFYSCCVSSAVPGCYTLRN